MEPVIVPINNLAVLIAAIISMMIGGLWYGPLFGKTWIKMSGLTDKGLAEAKKKGIAKSYGLMFLGSLVMSYVLAHAIVFASAFMQVEGISAGLMSGFWNWLGFVAPVTLSPVLWEGKSPKLWLLNNGYYLVTLLTMGSLLAAWR